MLSINNGNVYLGKGRLLKRSLLVDNGSIIDISSSSFARGDIIDCSDMWVLPGAIDPHVHFRIPGNEDKEDWLHGSKAAASAGVTTVLDMPNTNPPTTTKENLEEKVKIASSDSLVNFGFHFGVSLDNLAQIKSVVSSIASLKVYFGSSTGSLLVSSASYLKKVLEVAGSTPMAFHAEDEQILRLNIKKHFKEEDKIDILDYHDKLRDKDCAYSAVKKILGITEGFPKARLYFCHVSTVDELNLIDKACGSMNVYVEATPHHIFLSKEALQRQNKSYLGKVNPPIRSEKERSLLYSAFIQGKIDTIGTDHAPHLVEEKKRAYHKAPSGMPGLESFVPLLLNEVYNKNISLESFARLSFENAARIFSIKDKAYIKKGFDADIMIVSPNAKYLIEEKSIYTKSKWNPFLGKSLRGKVIKTIVGGKVAFCASNGFTKKGSGKKVSYSSR